MQQQQLEHNVNTQLDDELQNSSHLLKSLLNTKLIDINEIHNFLNQTLLHIASERNLIGLCKHLIQYGANCMFEDNYRQTPLIIAAKSNYYELVKLFINSIKLQTQLYMYENYKEYNLIKQQQISKAAYYAVCANNYEIVKYLFETFELNSEQLQFDNHIEIISVADNTSNSCANSSSSNDSDSDVMSSSQGNSSSSFSFYNCNSNKNCIKIKLKYESNYYTSELNALHVVCYNSYYQLVEYLIEHSINKANYINMPINKFRDSTPLEEAFKGLLALNLNYEFDVNFNKRRYFTNLLGNNSNCTNGTSTGGGNNNCTCNIHDYETRRNNKKCQEVRFKQIINYLIENGAKFSTNFLINNDLTKILQQIFYGELKNVNFIHYLNCLKFLFQYKIEDLFQIDNFNCKIRLITSKSEAIKESHNADDTTNTEFDTTTTTTTSDCYYKRQQFYVNKMLNELLSKIYAIILKILKDYKQTCLSYYYNLVVLLINELNNKYIKLDRKVFLCVKERNQDLYETILNKLNNPLSLKQLSYSKIKNSITLFGINKVNKLDLPAMLKSHMVPDYEHIHLEFY